MHTTMWNRFTGILGLLALGFGLISSFVFHSFGDVYTVFHLAVGTMLILYWFVTVGTKRASETKQIVQGRTVRFGLTAILYSIFFLGILASVNWLVNRYDKRLDLTEEGVYSLSSQSIQVLQSLKKPLKIAIFDLPQQDQKEQSEQSPKDLLALYKDKNPGLVTTEFINPRSKPELVDQYGMKSDNLVYLEYGTGDTKAVSRISSPTEEAITNAVVKLTQGEAKKVYFLQGHGEPGLEDTTERGLKSFSEAVKDDHLEMEGMVLSQKQKVPDDAAAVVWIGPMTPLLPGEKDALTQYVEKGGRALVMTNPREGADVRSFASGFGITIDNDVVIDVVQRLMMGPALATEFLANNFGYHEITKKLTKQDVIVFNMASSVRATGKSDGTTTYTNLVSSSDNGWGETNLKSIFDSAEPTATFDPDDIKGPVAIGIAYEKKLAGDKAKADASKDNSDANISRLVVFGNTAWITNKYLQYSSHKDLVLNSLNWLAGQESSIAIRPRTMRGSLRPIGTETFRTLLLSGFVLPECILIFGLVTWWRRRTLAV